MGGPAGLGWLAVGVVVALTTSGCVAAGLAGGPLVSAVQLIGDRSVERTVAAELGEAQGVTEAVLTRMAFRIESRERTDGVRHLRAVADGVTVHARLERVTAAMTRVGLRVEAGKLLADRDTGTQIHEQIAALLVPATARPAVSDPAATEALTALQGEIRKLRSDIEERRATETPVPTSDARTTVRVNPGAVFAAPMSAALPTVGGPAPSVSVAVPAASTPVAPPVSSRPHAAESTADAGTVAPLQPAGALTPILPTTGLRNGR